MRLELMRYNGAEQVAGYCACESTPSTLGYRMTPLPLEHEILSALAGGTRSEVEFVADLAAPFVEVDTTLRHLVDAGIVQVVGTENDETFYKMASSRPARVPAAAAQSSGTASIAS
ncbi:MAG: hypothetical protein ACLPUT_01865 [Solirubrobacteraceae bacterium]